jgi:hypothetical protein
MMTSPNVSSWQERGAVSETATISILLPEHASDDPAVRTLLICNVVRRSHRQDPRPRMMRAIWVDG